MEDDSPDDLEGIDEELPNPEHTEKKRKKKRDKKKRKEVEDEVQEQLAEEEPQEEPEIAAPKRGLLKKRRKLINDEDSD